MKEDVSEASRMTPNNNQKLEYTPKMKQRDKQRVTTTITGFMTPIIRYQFTFSIHEILICVSYLSIRNFLSHSCLTYHTGGTSADSSSGHTDGRNHTSLSTIHCCNSYACCCTQLCYTPNKTKLHLECIVKRPHNRKLCNERVRLSA